MTRSSKESSGICGVSNVDARTTCESTWYTGGGSGLGSPNIDQSTQTEVVVVEQKHMEFARSYLIFFFSKWHMTRFLEYTVSKTKMFTVLFPGPCTCTIIQYLSPKL